MAKAMKVLSYVKNSPAYKKMSPELQQKIQEKLYDKLTPIIYTKKGLVPPTKEEWTKKQFKPIGKNETLYSGGRLVTSVFSGDIYGAMDEANKLAMDIFTGAEPTRGEKATVKYVGHSAQMLTELMDSAEAKFNWLSYQFGKRMPLTPAPPKDVVGQKRVEWEKDYDKFFGESLEENKRKYQGWGALPSFTAQAAANFEEDHPMRKFSEKVMGFGAEMAAEAPIFIAMNKGLEAVGAAGAGKFPVLLKFSKLLEQSKLGRVALKTLTDATEGATWEFLTKTDPHLGEGARDFIIMGKTFRGAGKVLGYSGKLGGKILDKAGISDYLGKVFPIFGKQAYGELTAETIKMLEEKGLKMEGPKTEAETRLPIPTTKVMQDDKVIARLKEANAAVLSSIAQSKFQKPWYDLNYGQKQSVLKELAKQTALIAQNPAAHNPAAATIELANNIEKQAKTNPIFKDVTDQFTALEKKLGTKDSVVESGQAIHQHEKMTLPNSVPKVVEKINEAGTKTRAPIAVGAARKEDIAFTKGLTNILDNTNFADVHFESRPTHQLVALWASLGQIKETYGESVAKIIEDRIREEFPGATKKDLNAMSRRLVKHINMLDKTGHLEEEGNMFRSTKLDGTTTKWQDQLEQEFRDVKRARGKK